MKIGILSLHRANNYGAVLQCYALQQALTEVGHDVYVIDYRQPDTELSYKPISKERIHRCLSRPIALAKDILCTPFKQYAANFDCISIREAGIANWLKANNVCDARIDIDPTLLLNPTEWIKLASKQRPCKQRYLLSYYLMPEQKEVAKKVARRHGLKYIELGHKAYSPADFLTWVKYAYCVVVGSFHITVFSILFSRKFYIIQKNSGFDIRSASLLKSLGLENHFIPISKLPQVDITASVKFTDALASLRCLKNNSREYISSI